MRCKIALVCSILHRRDAFAIEAEKLVRRECGQRRRVPGKRRCKSLIAVRRPGDPCRRKRCHIFIRVCIADRHRFCAAGDRIYIRIGCRHGSAAIECGKFRCALTCGEACRHRRRGTKRPGLVLTSRPVLEFQRCRHVLIFLHEVNKTRRADIRAPADGCRHDRLRPKFVQAFDVCRQCAVRGRRHGHIVRHGTL